MRQFRPLMLNRTSLGPTDLNQLALNTQSWGRLRASLFALTGSPRLFGHRLKDENICLIHAHFGPDATYALPLARSLGVPLAVTFHGFDCTTDRKDLLRSGRYSNWRYLLLEQRLREQAIAFIAVSHFIESVLLERGYPRDKIIQHYIGVDIQKFHPINERSDSTYIFCVGRHTMKKGLGTLLRAFARITDKHPDVNLIQVGSGTLTEELKYLANTLGIAERVRFLGARSSDEVRQLMQRCALFVLPSQTAENGDSEALGIVFNEASACGIPVVSTRHGGIPEAVLHGETGLLVDERDDRALAEAMDQILGDPYLGSKLGKRGREYVCDVFDLSKQTAKLEDIYETLLR